MWASLIAGPNHHASQGCHGDSYMDAKAPNTQMTRDDDLSSGIRKRALQILFQMLLTGGILFLSSGRLDWWMAWAYLGIQIAGIIANAIVLMRVHPELIAERAQTGPGTKDWDKTLASLGVLASLGTLLFAGLDVRFGWSTQISPLLQMAALVPVAGGFAFSSWAMVSNAFFAGTVRIQEERGHAVCSSGPYRLMRHPGYAGWTLSGLATPVMLGSLWALVPAVLTAAILVVRTSLEDKTLQEELTGYAEYAQEVRCRLVPGVW